MYKLSLPAFLLVILLPAMAIAADQGSITVHITGLRNDKGVARIALFASSATYAASGNTGDMAFKKVAAPISAREAVCTFQDLPFGDYALKVFHDEDNSGRFVTNMFGMPKVQYGFSNNAHAMFGAPDYEKAKFKLDSSQLNMEIKMQNR